MMTHGRNKHALCVPLVVAISMCKRWTFYFISIAMTDNEIRLIHSKKTDRQCIHSLSTRNWRKSKKIGKEKRSRNLFNYLQLHYLREVNFKV